MKKLTSFLLFLFSLWIGIFGSLKAQQVSTTEFDALVDLYNLTNGATWNNTVANNQIWDVTNPMSDVSTWYGITVTDIGEGSFHVTSIELLNNNLTGTLPTSIKDFSYLETFDLANNDIGGDMPNEIGNVGFLNETHNLTDLYLNNNQFSSIPKEIGELVALKNLTLQEQFDGTNRTLDAIPDDIKNLINLESLILSGNNLTALPAEIGNLISLITLDIRDNKITSLPSSISDLSSLELFYATDNKISILPPNISNLFNLRELLVDSNELASLPSTIGDLATLEKLYFNDNNITGSLPDISSLTNLTELKSNNNFLLMGDIEYLVSNLASTLTTFTYTPQARYAVSQENYNIITGSTVILDAFVYGSGIEYQWYEYTAFPSFSVISGATSSTYEASATNTIYFCTVTSTVTNNGITLTTPLASKDITVNVVEPNALKFDGDNDFVELDSYFVNTGESSFTGNNFTIEFWIKAPTTTENSVILSKWNETEPTKGGFILQLLPSGHLEFKTDAPEKSAQSAKSIADNEWHHVAIVTENFFGGTFVYMYVDGFFPEDYFTITEGNINETNYPLLLGKEAGNSIAHFEGAIDELRIWQTDRSCSEINANMNNEINPSFESFLLAYYTFNQGEAAGDNTGETALRDDSVNDRGGILTNFGLTGNNSNWVQGNSSISGTEPNTSPKLHVTGGSDNLDIENGDNTPSKEDRTNFGIVDNSRTFYFGLAVSQASSITITDIIIDDGGSGQFTLDFSLPKTFSACVSEAFGINFEPTVPDIQRATITIKSTTQGRDNTDYTFDVQGQGAPTINVFEIGIEGDAPVSDNEPVNLGQVDRCGSTSKFFKISNSGFSNLLLNGNIIISGNSAFKVTSQPNNKVEPTSLAGDYTEFEITYTPTKDETQEAIVAIYSNDENQSLFTFSVTGEGNYTEAYSYTDYDWEVVGNTDFSPQSASYSDLKIAQDDADGIPYIAFQDASVGGATSVMTYNGTNWEYVGEAGITSDVAINQSLAITKDGTLYVAYKSEANKVVVMKFDASWSEIGSFVGIGSLQLALDIDNNLYLAFENEFGKAQVLEYDEDDNDWENIGNDENGFSDGTVGSISIAIDSDETPYVAFQDKNNGGKLSVMRYNGQGWNMVDGQFTLPSIESDQQSIIIDNNDVVYVAFRNVGANTVTVLGLMKSFMQEGSSLWEDISGNLSEFSDVSIGNLLVDVDGSTYLSLISKSGSTADIVVTKYIPNPFVSSWEIFPTPVGNSFESPSIAFNTNGVLHIGYEDNSTAKTTVKKYVPTYSEINIQANDIIIENGDTEPQIDDNTDFGNVNTSKTLAYTIENNGTADLIISSIQFSNPSQSEFNIIGIPEGSIAAGDAITFDIIFFPINTGSFTNTVQISSNDCENNGFYEFAIKGQNVIGQDIDVLGNGVSIENAANTPNFADHTLFPNTLACGNAASTRTFTIKNEGTENLTVTNIELLGSSQDFTLTNLPPTTLVLAPTETYNFNVIFNPSLSGLSPQITVRINSDDIDEGTYTFTIQGIGLNDTQAPNLVALQNFTRDADQTECFYTNVQTTTNSVIRGIANDNCRIASYNFVLSGATQGNLTTLEAVKFNRGITTITWSATDENGNVSAPNQFTITVVDNQVPIIKAPSAITRKTDLYSCTADSIGINLGIPTVSDNCLLRVSNDAPTQFPIGQTTVIWTAIDSTGNTATAEQLITITEQLFVVPSDSLILVDIYNQTGGQGWVNTWDFTKPVSTWNGVGISCGRIISLNLSNNNLTGTLPASILNLEQINDPKFSLQIGGNRLNFESAEGFVGRISNFSYSPQAKLYSPLTETRQQSESITFSSETQGNFTSYQWYKNQIPINGATSPTFTITNALPSDGGIYVCQMKNLVANQLILERHQIRFTVKGFLTETDSLALVSIYEQTGGNTSWKTKWDLTQPVSTWAGVTVSGDKVVELDLSDFELTGTLPNVFDAELFSELRYLSLFDNDLEGEIPSSIGNLLQLTYLDLDKNNFEGSIPASFGNLTNLQAVWFSRNNLTSLPDEIGNLVNLKNLYLNDNKFQNLPETIGNLNELLVLNVSDNDLTSLPNSLTNLKKLVELYANRNFIIILPTGMENLIALTIFEINTNDLNSLEAGLLQLTNLRTLKVGENKLEFDDLLPFINLSFSIFDYAPQAPINERTDILADVNSSVTFTITTEGNGNRYQWFRDGNPVSTLQTFTINRVKNTDAGVYIAFITHPSLPNLTLERRSIQLNVECQAELNFEITPPQQTIFCEGQPFGLKLAISSDFTTDNQIRWRKDGIILAFANQKTYTVTQAGTYTAEILTANGCTTLSNKIEITTLPNPEVSISLSNEKVLESTINSQETVTYQWLKDGNSIENGFESSYTPTETGEYSLLVLTESGCSSVSEIIIFTADEVTGIEEPKELRNLALFPNPNNGSFFIDFGTNTPNGEPTFVLIDAIGRKINVKTERISSTRYQAKTTNMAGGIYYLQIQTQDGLAFRKFVIEE